MMISNYQMVSKWVAEKAGCSISDKGSAIGLTNSIDHLIAGVIYENFTGASVTATIAIEPGNVIPKSFIEYIFEYPFKELEVKKMFAMVAETNKASIDFVTRCGFREETRIKDYFEGGDMIVFACTPNDCKWMKE